jgi:hypothetical protein
VAAAAPIGGIRQDLSAIGQIGHMPDRRIFRMASGLDAPYYDLARIHSNAGFNRHFAFRAQTIGVATQLLLHRKCGMQRALRMVLVRDRSAGPYLKLVGLTGVQAIPPGCGRRAHASTVRG